MSTLTSTETPVLESFNPATGRRVGTVPVTAAHRVGDVVAAARRAQPTWARLTLQQRASHLRPAAAALVKQSDDLGRLLTDEMGKPLAEAIGEVRGCGEQLEAKLDEIIEALQPEPIEDEHSRSTIYHDPFGVCAAITPWNFPLAMPHWAVIPALMAGNTVVLKPSELTPLIAQAYADLLNEHLPKGVLQVVHGADEQGRALVEAPVDLIAFTGSRETGRRILAAAGPDLKRVILELGGKDPMIVLANADVEKAAAFAARSSFRNAGQVCVSTERIYVDRRIAEQFEREVARIAGELRVGPGTEEGVDVGPMVSAEQRDHVLRHIEQAVARGATVIAGGEGHHGNYVMPTVLANVDHDMAVMRDETFGPVAAIMRFDDVEEAVALANDTPFGLGATVFGPERKAGDVARRLTAGMIGVNKSCGGAAGTPWVGARQSGYGYHGGRDGHRQFSQARVVSSGKRQP